MARTKAQPVHSRRINASEHLIRLAAIDVGSNSIHMIVAQADVDGSITTLWRNKEMVGLGRGSFPSHRLSQRLMDMAMESLWRCAESARRRQCEKIVAVATSAVREAENGGDFIERVRRELGLNLRVISAREEARLIYLGVRQVTDLKNGPNFIIDIGGGSTEFIVGDQQKAVLLESRKLGAARMTAQYIKSDPVDARDLKRLLAHYDEVLTPLCEQIAHLKPMRTIGTSGTLESLAAMCNGRSNSSGRHNGEHAEAPIIEVDRLKRLVAELIESRSKDREKMRGLDTQRHDQIMAGAILVNEVFRRVGIKRLQIAGGALREGILIDYLERKLPDLIIRREVPDPRRRSVLDLARRCGWFAPHAEQVARLTGLLFDQLKPQHKLGVKPRELIEYGALLHDIGWHIHKSGHHKHSQYLILHGDLRGFSTEETAAIACIARYHRKSTPNDDHEIYADLSSEMKKTVRIGSALLRIADGMDRSHCRVITGLKVKARNKRLEVLIEGRGDAELDIWGARRKMDYLAELFDRTISFEQVKR